MTIHLSRYKLLVLSGFMIFGTVACTERVPTTPTPTTPTTPAPTPTPTPTPSGPPDDIVFVGSSPAPGSTIVIDGRGGPIMTFTFSVVFSRALSTHVLQIDLASDGRAAFNGTACAAAVSAPFSLAAGEVRTVSFTGGNFFVSGDRRGCVAPLTVRSIGAVIRPNVDGFNPVLRKDFAVSYNFVP